MKAKDVQDVKDILGDPSRCVVPLLQHFLLVREGVCGVICVILVMCVLMS